MKPTVRFSVRIAILLIILILTAFAGWSWSLLAAATVFVVAILLEFPLARRWLQGTVRDRSDRGEESPFLVTFNEESVRVTCPGRKTESVLWKDLIVVGIRIEQAFFAEPWWVLGGTDRSGCLFPATARGSGELLSEMQRRLPGFDNRALIEVMGSVDKGRVIWEREKITAEDGHG